MGSEGYAMIDRVARLAGVEFYFDDFQGAKAFYRDVLGLALEEDEAGHHAKFALGTHFLCLERKGVENYPSAEKGVVFVEVPDVRAAVSRLGPAHVVGSRLEGERPWAAIRDPEGHTIMLLQATKPGRLAC